MKEKEEKTKRCKSERERMLNDTEKNQTTTTTTRQKNIYKKKPEWKHY